MSAIEGVFLFYTIVGSDGQTCGLPGDSNRVAHVDIECSTNEVTKAKQ